MNFVRHYLLALQFFTRIPVTGRLAAWVGYSAESARASLAHFPGVGWLVGSVAALGYGGVALLLPDVPLAPVVAAVLSTVLTVLLTGALHEDGLADVADGLGGGTTREAALAIMKDSRVGAYGVLALVLALAAKVSLLALLGSMDLELTCAALLLAHVVSRFLPLLLVRLLPYVGSASSSKSRTLAEGQISGARLLAGLLWTAPVVAAVVWFVPGSVWWGPLLLAALAWVWMWRLYARRLQGHTGDCLGATQQVCELGFYLGLAFTL